jgi:DNA-binding NarL/FixJ family response regulator
MSLKQELEQEFGDSFIIETAMDANGAKEAINELIKLNVEIILIISDWLMPGIKGDEFLAEIKRTYKEIKCIIISGHADQSAIDKAKKEVGLDAYIKKPWEHNVLINAVKCCIE